MDLVFVVLAGEVIEYNYVKYACAAATCKLGLKTQVNFYGLVWRGFL